MQSEDLETMLIRSQVASKANSVVGSHYLRGTTGYRPKKQGNTLQLLENKAPDHMFACENSYRRCSGRHGHPSVTGRPKGEPGNAAHLANPSAYRWVRRVTFSVENELYGESCVDRRHFDCLGLVRWCLKGINATPSVGKYPSIKGYKKMCSPISEYGAHLGMLHAGDLVFRNGFEHIGIVAGSSSAVVFEARVEADGVMASPATGWEWHGRLPREFWLGKNLP
ncbi:MAG TPA: hypothetical protein VE129_20575 [Thermoanaerobaculia bacterium]|nr:hypothetical protein [Thermoanaerobaculia bacterium]